MAFDKEEFYRALGAYLGVPEDVTITDVEEDTSYYQGCSTCGGDYEYSVDVTGVHRNGKRYWKSFDGKLGDFIRSL